MSDHPTSSGPDTLVAPAGGGANNESGEFVVRMFQEHATPLLRYLTSRFGSSEEAQEVAQEAWLRIFRLNDPQGVQNPKAFLFQTATNLAIDRARHDKVAQRFIESQEHVQQEQVDVERRVAEQQRLDIVQQAMYDLPPKCRQAFSMHRHGGLSYPEIAESLGVSTSMVEKYMIRALKHFRDALAKAERS